jgi:hypothetical protein
MILLCQSMLWQVEHPAANVAWGCLHVPGWPWGHCTSGSYKRGHCCFDTGGLRSGAKHCLSLCWDVLLSSVASSSMSTCRCTALPVTVRNPVTVR